MKSSILSLFWRYSNNNATNAPTGVPKWVVTMPKQMMIATDFHVLNLSTEEADSCRSRQHSSSVRHNITSSPLFCSQQLPNTTFLQVKVPECYWNDNLVLDIPYHNHNFKPYQKQRTPFHSVSGAELALGLLYLLWLWIKPDLLNNKALEAVCTNFKEMYKHVVATYANPKLLLPKLKAFLFKVKVAQTKQDIHNQVCTLKECLVRNS